MAERRLGRLSELDRCPFIAIAGPAEAREECSGRPGLDRTGSGGRQVAGRQRECGPSMRRRECQQSSPRPNWIRAERSSRRWLQGGHWIDSWPRRSAREINHIADLSLGEGPESVASAWSVLEGLIGPSVRLGRPANCLFAFSADPPGASPTGGDLLSLVGALAASGDLAKSKRRGGKLSSWLVLLLLALLLKWLPLRPHQSAASLSGPRAGREPFDLDIKVGDRLYYFFHDHHEFKSIRRRLLE